MLSSGALFMLRRGAGAGLVARASAQYASTGASAPSTTSAGKSRRSRKSTKAAAARNRKHGELLAAAAPAPADAAPDDDEATNVVLPPLEEVEIDEVERLLASTSTGASPRAPQQQHRHPTGSVTRSASGPRSPVSPDTIVDPGSALHFKAVHQAATATVGGRPGPTHAQLERIERRRSKPSLAEVEFDVGVTERLVPELARLPALHEVHYGDAVVRELDRSAYFAAAQAQRARTTTASSSPTPVGRAGAACAPAPGPVLMIRGEPCVEVSLDEDLSESTFAAFDAETGSAALPDPRRSSGPDGAEDEEDEAVQGAATTAEAGASAAAAAPPPQSSGGADPARKNDGHGAEVQRAGHHDAGAERATEDSVGLDDDDGDGEAGAVTLSFGAERPWFVPASGVVRLHPLPPRDCARLLRFVLHLRQQTAADLSPSVRRALLAAEAETDGDSAAGSAKATHQQGQASPPPPPLSLADVIRYLDTAPPPVLAFTESLPAPNAASRVEHSTASASSSPAFVFHLYLENVSGQNALAHLAALFGIPQRALRAHTAVSKMSCSTVICAVAENRLRREHLLLINTLRHPGFVMRVSDVQEVPAALHASSSASPSTSEPSTSHDLLAEVARWQPLYHTEVLLRRVCSENTSSSSSTAGSARTPTRQQLEHRLRAVQAVGAICFCANREASLARAATDVLHGFFRSAVLNALQRRKAPLPLTRFLWRPNVATAQHAHHVSTDPTVRQVLKVFMQTGGDWHATVAQTPYVWRRRWINALRGLVWNTMASRRMRQGGRKVLVGDVVLKPELRSDVRRRGIMTVKAEHVMVVATPAQAEAACMEDVFLPFLRGRYPENLFADQASEHPIMTRTNMLALLRAMHAPQLLLGLSDEMRLLLDVRADAAPTLFRRLLVRPLAFDFTILEDKPPMRCLHFDAARLLTNDRWLSAAAASPRQPTAPPTAPPHRGAGTDRKNGAADAPGPRDDDAALSCSHLLPPSEVLERTTLGARLSSGVLAEEFFSVPPADDFVVLGHAHRHLSGELVASAPHSNTADVGDRVYSVYIRAVVEHNLAGLSNLLREYFVLSGIETEGESALQHKVHRLRRELDPETPLLTASVYCPTCFNRDHDTQEQCAEYQYKRHQRSARLDVATSVLQQDSRASAAAHGAAASEASSAALASGAAPALTAAASPESAGGGRTSGPLSAAMVPRRVCMRWRLRRGNEEQRWGVHLTKSLHLVGIEDGRLVREAAVWCAGEGGALRSETSAAADGRGTHGPAAATRAMAMPADAAAAAPADADGADVCPWPIDWITQGNSGSGNTVPTQRSQLEHTALAEFLTSVMGSGGDEASLPERLQRAAVLRLTPITPTTTAALQLPKVAKAASPLKACKWRLTSVNKTAVTTQRDVAAALLTQAATSREVWLTFEMPLDVARPGPSSAADDSATVVKGGTGTAAGAEVARHKAEEPRPQTLAPQSTAALPPPRRHAAEAALQRALCRVAPETQRWARDLPYRLTIVLAKRHREVRAQRSWGLQLDGTDMTLLNFAALAMGFVHGSQAPHDERAEGDEEAGAKAVPSRRGGGAASVVSIAPGDAFLRTEPAASRVWADVTAELLPLLNDAYRVVRLHRTPVRHKAEAAQAMAEFQAAVEAKVAARDAMGGPAAGEEEEKFFLTLALERKASSYRLCTSAAASPAAVPHDATPIAAATPRPPASLPEGPAPGTAVEAGASSAPAAAEAAGVDAALLAGVATAHCPVRALTTVQLSRSVVTIAINRLLLTSATRDRWGLRLQPGTRRLKALQHNKHFSFHVFAAKKSQGTRISDTLRGVYAYAADAEGRSATPASASAVTRAHHLFFVEQVNREHVHTHRELRRALHDAAQPQPLAPSSGQRDADQVSTAAVAALPPESVTLKVRQIALLRLSVTVRRGGVGEASALGPVGLQVDKRMHVVSVFAGTAMARALEEAAGPQCSARELIRDRTAPASAQATAAATTTTADASLAGGRRSGWNVVADEVARTLVVQLAYAMTGASASSSTTTSDGAVHRRTAAREVSAPLRRQWQYDKDEDEDEPLRDAQQGSSAHVAAAAAKPGDAPALVTETLKELAARAVHTQQQFSLCTMADGVHVLQACVLHEFATALLERLQTREPPASAMPPEEAGKALTELWERLAAVKEAIRWEVTYAAEANRPLRTPADLAAVFAPGVAEETIILQQLIEE